MNKRDERFVKPEKKFVSSKNYNGMSHFSEKAARGAVVGIKEVSLKTKKKYFKKAVYCWMTQNLV
jgi:hypothetical protein